MAWTVSKIAGSPIVVIQSDASAAAFDATVAADFLALFPNGAPAWHIDVLAANGDKTLVRDRSATGGILIAWDFVVDKMQTRRLYGSRVYPYVAVGDQTVADWSKLTIQLLVQEH